MPTCDWVTYCAAGYAGYLAASTGRSTLIASATARSSLEYCIECRLAAAAEARRTREIDILWSGLVLVIFVGRYN